MKYGFIGLGNMATAIIGGLLQKGMAKPEEIFGYDKNEAASAKIKDNYKITTVIDAKEAAIQADVLFLAVKPNVLGDVLSQISPSIRKDTIVISIAAGKTIAFLEEKLSRTDCKLVRCMPNTPALVLEGCTGFCTNENVTDSEKETTISILSAFGKAIPVSENQMDIVVGVSGSSPAYVFLFIEAMADAAVAAGMPRANAYTFCAQAVLGSAKLLLETGKHPGELKDMVCSPGGTTIAAVKVLEEQGFRGTVMDAVQACIDKSGKL